MDYSQGIVRRRRVIPASSSFFVASASSSGVTWDPAHKTSGITLSNGNLTVAADGVAPATQTQSTTAHSSGKYYVEFFNDVYTAAAVNQGIGLIGSTFVLGSTFVGGDANSCCVYSQDGEIFISGAGTGVATGAFPSSPVMTLMLAIDCDNNRFWARKNDAGGTTGWFGSAGGGDPATNSLGLDISAFAASKLIAFDSQTVACQWTARFASGSWGFSAPSGFGAW